jgi:hypothetical protein
MAKKPRDAEPTNSDLKHALDALDSKVKSTSPKFDPKEHKDKTRSKIAFAFTIGYFILMGASLIGVPIYNLFIYFLFGESSTMTMQLRDVLLAVSGITSGPIGFVVGYYFKGSEDNG